MNRLFFSAESANKKDLRGHHDRPLTQQGARLRKWRLLWDMGDRRGEGQGKEECGSYVYCVLCRSNRLRGRVPLQMHHRGGTEECLVYLMFWMCSNISLFLAFIIFCNRNVSFCRSLPFALAMFSNLARTASMSSMRMLLICPGKGPGSLISGRLNDALASLACCRRYADSFLDLVIRQAARGISISSDRSNQPF